jgi:8-oxo-dGTP pyrophosphatase MutT (NUDIX family)
MEQGAVLLSGAARPFRIDRDFVLRRFAEHVPGRRRSPTSAADDGRIAGLPAPPAAAMLPPGSDLPNSDSPGTDPLESPCRGDHDLNPGAFETDRPLTAAAVLVPLVDRPEGMTVLFTRRAETLPRHAGQISFPGGCIEPQDPDAVAAALRESAEEIGLPPADVQIIGRLDTYLTRTGFQVSPVVGIIDPPLALAPDPLEVAEIFEAPLAFLVDRANHRRESREFNGSLRHFYAMPWERHYIWGVTAGMLVNLCDVLDPSA